MTAKQQPQPDQQALELRAAQHLEACKRDERYALVVVVVDLATEQVCLKYNALPLPDVREFWREVLAQASALTVAAKEEKFT